MSAAKSILLDSNIWLDYYLGHREHHKEAFQLIEYTLSEGIELLYAVTTLKDVFYLIDRESKRQLRSHLGRELTNADAQSAQITAFACLSSMQDIATPVALDVADTWLALKLKHVHTDFEDDLIIAAAQRAGADYLVTNDKLLIAHAPLTAMSSADMLHHLQVCEQARQALAAQ